MGSNIEISVENGTVYIRRYGSDIEYSTAEARRIAHELLEAADEAGNH